MTRFVFTAEQDELRRTVRAALAAKSPSWEPGLTIAEKYGGSGGGPVEQLIVCEQMGRVLLDAPYLASAVLAATALLASGDIEAQAGLLPQIAAGTTTATLVVPAHSGIRANQGSLTGRAEYVIDGEAADTLLIAAGGTLFAVDAGSPGLTRRPMQALDLTRKLAVIELDRVIARQVGAEGAAEQIVDQAILAGVLALTAEQVGGAQRCLDMSVDYAKLRHQFGRPIGSFQAIKHRCADMLLDVESARSAAYAAAWAAQDRDPELPLLASLAKAHCSEVYERVATENIQIHGGIGFTWEHEAHLYYRRARSSAQMLGTVVEHREIAAGYLLRV
jgi:alkylation response protein AidB-like acyl-CoA dehydrogenase